jgi:hypothetical protein
MTPRRCARLWQVDAYREGRFGTKDMESCERHLRACADCSAKMASDERLRALALALPVDEPKELALHRLRARVLRDAATGIAPSPHTFGRRVAALIAFVIASAFVVTLAVRRSGPQRPALGTVPTGSGVAVGAPEPPAAASEPFAATVAGEADARWLQAREQRRERVDLEEGTVHVHVRPQDADERFLVVMPDGEIEVRGTTFDVTVQRGKTILVHVQSGVVELRLRARAVVRLADGDAWPLPSAVSSLSPRAPALASVQPAPPAPLSSDNGVSSYSAAVQQLREGRYEEAAAAFHAFVAKWPQSSQAEDASFLEAVALARAGRPDAAGLAAERHITSFPLSFHRKEAAILVERAAALRRPQNP